MHCWHPALRTDISVTVIIRHPLYRAASTMLSLSTAIHSLCCGGNVCYSVLAWDAGAGLQHVEVT